MSKKLKWIIAVVVVVLVGFVGYKFVNKGETKTDLAGVQDAGVVKIGLEGTFPPYSYHDKNGKLKGFEVELGKNIAKKMGVKVKFIESKWDSLISGLDSGRFDMVINNVGMDKTREAKYSFSDPYIYSHARLAVSTENTTITKPADLKGKKAAQSASSDNARFARDLGATIASVDGFSQAVDLVTQGRADGTINDDVSFYTYKKTQEDAGKTMKLKLIPGTISTGKVGVLMKKSDQNMTKEVNKVIAEMKEDGSLAKLSVEYFGSDVTKK